MSRRKLDAVDGVLDELVLVNNGVALSVGLLLVHVVVGPVLEDGSLAEESVHTEGDSVLLQGVDEVAFEGSLSAGFEVPVEAESFSFSEFVFLFDEGLADLLNFSSSVEQVLELGLLLDWSSLCSSVTIFVWGVVEVSSDGDSGSLLLRVKGIF